ncbi:hypothetical protein DAI22_12g167401 [Oryza sativa Japonica Group]|nr:hypothetical protein DAI22_12g167401 [Oryza sativa Japonica Group]
MRERSIMHVAASIDLESTVANQSYICNLTRLDLFLTSSMNSKWKSSGTKLAQ